MHDAPESMIVVHRVVLSAAVVPERERARLPAKAAGEFRPDLMLEEKLEQGPALLLAQSLEVRRVADVDEKRLASGFRMGARDGMLRNQHLRFHRITSYNVCYTKLLRSPA